MRTIQDLQNELDALLDEASQYKHAKPSRELMAEIKMIRQLIRYLETSPTEQMVKGQLSEVRRKLKFIPSRYEGWFENLSNSEKQMPERKLKARFNKEHEVSKLKTQLRALNKLIQTA